MVRELTVRELTASDEEDGEVDVIVPTVMISHYAHLLNIQCYNLSILQYSNQLILQVASCKIDNAIITLTQLQILIQRPQWASTLIFTLVMESLWT